ncbi:uncharacterized protein LOC141714831 [Apium graveolens]|uniref:uncharacterized protein LOC141714831 n=1 Tax=Apium graveolens TaxID=4045 RepID=UPI003D7979A5
MNNFVNHFGHGVVGDIYTVQGHPVPTSLLSWNCRGLGNHRDLPLIHLLPKHISISSFMAKWGRVFFHKFREKVINQKEALDSLKDREDNDGIQTYFSEKAKLEELLLQEESYWKQRAKIFWLEEGDTNSRFFHASASSRKKINHIASLQDDDGRVLTNHNDLCSLLKEYYSNIFTETNQENDFPDYENEVRVTAEQNNQLTEDLSFEEFTEAIKSMHPDKASGPDGLNPTFFQHFWKLIGKEKEKVEEVKDLRPIAMCNVLYKIVAKVLANRLKRVLPGLISEEQSAFVPGRSIMDNVLMASELIHYVKRKSSGTMGEKALKLAISKAYNRVRWGYLKKRKVSTGFSDKWISWMMIGNIRRDKQAELKDIIQVHSDLGNSKYLGLPSLVGRSKKVDFNYLKDKIWSKIKGWNTKLLSREGKAVLLRNVAQCIPALLQARRTGWLSFTWSGIWEAKEFVKDGLRWVMGDGRSINIYQDRWLRGKPDYCVDQYTQQQAPRDTKVCDFLLKNQKAWDECKIRRTFNTVDAEAILAVRVSQCSTKDRVAWLHSINGRLCRNNVPVRYVLREKRVMVPIGCTMCTGGDIEHLIHVFFECGFAKACWQYMGVKYDMSAVDNAPEWLLTQL